MTTLTISAALGLAEMMKRRYNGVQLTVAETLAQINMLVATAPVREANDIWSHVSTRHNTLASPSARKLNAGGTRAHSETEQVRERIMLLELPVEIDEDIIDHEPDPAQAMADEISMDLEGVAQKLAYYLIYGNPATNAEELRGFMPRRAALSANCVGAGGTGSDMTSVYVVEWSPRSMNLIYPKGSPSMGVEVNDKGKLRVTDSSHNPYWAYVHQIKVQLGLNVVEERSLQRIANIESTNATNNFIDATKVRLLVAAINRLPLAGLAGQAFIYANRTAKTQLDIYGLEKSNGFYTVDNLTGGPMTMFRGLPVLLVEQITDTELAAA